MNYSLLLDNTPPKPTSDHSPPQQQPNATQPTEVWNAWVKIWTQPLSKLWLKH